MMKDKLFYQIGRWFLPIIVVLMAQVVVVSNAIGQQVTLRWATWGPESVDRQLIDAFEREHPHIHIEYIPTSGTGAHHQKLKISTAAGVGADIFAVDGVYLVEFVTMGLIESIDDLLDKEESFRMDEFFPAALPDVQYQGNTYGLPYISAPLYMVYNMDHVSEIGFSKPDINWDTDEFYEYATSLTRVSSDQIIRHGTTQFLQTGSHAIWPWLWSAGARMFDDDNSRFMLGEPEATAVMNWMAELSLSGISGGSGADFARQEASIHAMYPGGFPTVKGIDLGFEWDVVIHPKGPGGQYSVWKGNVMGISPFTEHKDEAWTFLKWLLSPVGGGYEIYIANKRFPPSTRDVDLWDLYQGQGVGSDPKSLNEVSLRLASQHGRPLPHLLQWSEIINGVIKPALDRIASGVVPAQIAVEEIDSMVEQFLRSEP